MPIGQISIQRRAKQCSIFMPGYILKSGFSVFNPIFPTNFMKTVRSFMVCSFTEFTDHIFTFLHFFISSKKSIFALALLMSFEINRSFMFFKHSGISLFSISRALFIRSVISFCSFSICKSNLGSFLAIFYICLFPDDAPILFCPLH